jgi:hypothetical protein
VSALLYCYCTSGKNKFEKEKKLLAAKLTAFKVENEKKYESGELVKFRDTFFYANEYDIMFDLGIVEPCFSRQCNVDKNYGTFEPGVANTMTQLEIKSALFKR